MLSSIHSNILPLPTENSLNLHIEERKDLVYLCVSVSRSERWSLQLIKDMERCEPTCNDCKCFLLCRILIHDKLGKSSECFLSEWTAERECVLGDWLNEENDPPAASWVPKPTQGYVKHDLINGDITAGACLLLQDNSPEKAKLDIGVLSVQPDLCCSCTKDDMCKTRRLSFSRVENNFASRAKRIVLEN